MNEECRHCGKEFDKTHPLKVYCSTKCKSLGYYYANKKKVLDYQKNRWKDKYQNDLEFRNKRQLRDASRFSKGCLRTLKGKSCSKCGSDNDLQRHHPDYNSIKTIILCRSCHNVIHHSPRLS